MKRLLSQYSPEQIKQMTANLALAHHMNAACRKRVDGMIVETTHDEMAAGVAKANEAYATALAA